MNIKSTLLWIPLPYLLKTSWLLMQYQYSRWGSVLRLKTSKTLFRPVNFSIFFKNYIKINSRIWFEPVNSNFHSEDCNITFKMVPFCIFILINKNRLWNDGKMHSTTFNKISVIHAPWKLVLLVEECRYLERHWYSLILTSWHLII